MSNDTLSAMLKQYEDNTATPTKNTEAKVYDLKNYFTTFIGEKEKSATKRIRILPTSDGSSPFVEIHGHKIQVENEWKTFICLKHEKGLDCPFCQTNDALRAKNTDADKELAKKYNARRMYVVKLIDRDKEEEGVKFWRFNHDYRNQGILDKIFGVLKAVNKDITHPETGRDLQVMIARDQKNVPIVQSITHVDPTPLSEDVNLAKEWLSDSRTWEDVYSIKPYEYLEIIIKGGTPAWDKEAKKFIDKAAVVDTTNNEVEAELTLGVPNVKDNVTTASNSTPQTQIPVEDDLPF